MFLVFLFDIILSCNMLTTDDLSGRSRKRQVPLLFLLALNAGVGHILTDQVSELNVNAAHIIKDEQVINQDIESGETVSESEMQIVEEIKEDDSQDKSDNSIVIYEVKSGDTISSIASRFKVSVNTIRWANELNSKDTIKIGDKLTILPITGFQYKVKSGDTISAIAKKYDADSKEILIFNGFDDAKDLKAGMEIIIPNGEPQIEKPKSTTTTTKSTTTTQTSSNTTSNSSSSTSSTYAMPIPGSILTQGIHGTNAVDFGAPVGTPVKASLDGEVILSKGGGAYNGGYGNYIVIKHSNGTQTLYAHLSKTEVSVGRKVSKGDVIGKSGNTGRSTGPHLHFEVRGATNPFGKNKVGTKY